MGPSDKGLQPDRHSSTWGSTPVQWYLTWETMFSLEMPSLLQHLSQELMKKCLNITGVITTTTKNCLEEKYTASFHTRGVVDNEVVPVYLQGSKGLIAEHNE